MLKLVRLQCLWILIFTCTAWAVPMKQYDTREFKRVESLTNQLRKHYSAHEILLVFDIDNTLLAMDHLFGSDQWFSWQEQQLTIDKPRYRAAGDFKSLLALQGQIFQQGSMHTPEPETSAIISRLKQIGHPMFVLTSRGHEFAAQTMKEFQRNKLQLEPNCPSNDTHLAKAGVPYEPATAKKRFKLSANDYKGLRFDRTARPVLYKNCVFFTAGQHKGAMLRVIQHDLKLKPKVIIFVDDKGKHTTRVQDAYKNRPEMVYTFRYGAEDTNVLKVNSSAIQAHLHKQLGQFKHAMGMKPNSSKRHDILTDLFPPVIPMD